MKERLDWRLPTQDELVIMRKNLHYHGKGNFKDACYWASYEKVDPSYSCFKDFSEDMSKTIYNDDGFRIRAVRTFKVGSPHIYLYEIGHEIPNGFIFDIQGTTVFVCKKEDEILNGKEWFSIEEAIELFKSDEKVTSTESSKTHNLKDGVIVTSKVEFISDVISVVLSISNETYHYYNVNNEYNSRQFSTIEDCQSDIDLLVSKL